MKSNIISLHNDGSVYYRQAMKKKQQQQYQDALNLMEKALNESKDREYISEYAYLLTLVGRYDDAENYIFTEFKNNDFDTSFYYELSEMNVLIEDANKALLFGILYVDIYNDDDYYDNLLEMFTVEDFNYREILEEAEAFVYQYVFQTYFMKGEIETSLDFLDTLPLKILEQQTFRNMRGMALLFLNRFDEAEIVLTELLKEDQTDMHALSHLTLLYFYTNQIELYQKFLRHLEVVEPLDEDDRLKVGLVLNFLKRYDDAYELLLPLYKKKYMVNFQLLHALSQSAYYAGFKEESLKYWNEMQTYNPLDEIHSPWKKEKARETLNHIIDNYLQSDDSHKRILGLFKASVIEPEDVIIGSPMWALIDYFNDFEKIYTAYLFNQFKHKKFERLHEGLKVLSIDYLEQDDIMLGWIDEVTHLEMSGVLGDESGKVVALAFLYVYYEKEKSLEKISVKYDVDLNNLKEAIEIVKQNK